MNILGERLKALRKEKKVPQAYVSKQLGISQSAYAAYEVNQNQPNNEMLVLLAEYYEVSTDYLLGKTDTKYTQVELDFYNELKDKGIDQLIHEYNITLGDEALDEKEERILIKLIKSFMESDE